MTRLKALSSLLPRIQNASGADRDLSFELFRLLEATDERRAQIEKAEERIARGELTREDLLGWRVFDDSDSIRALTSIDAALKMVERLLPGWEKMFTDEDGDGSVWFASVGERGTFTGYRGSAPTAPRALLLVLVEALIEIEIETNHY